MDLEYLRRIEEKWQKIWERERVFEADLDYRKKKFFGTVPYPYTSGNLHIGHGRTYTIADIFFRYKRMQGWNVLWPMAFHITGTPVIGISKRIESGDKETLELFRDYVGTYIEDKREVEEVVKGFVDPWNIVKFFSGMISRDFKSLGFSIDWRRSFTSGEEIYKKFVEWQFWKLKEMGYIIQGNYPVLFCKNCESAVGEDDIVGGDIIKPKIGEYVLVKFRIGEEYLVAATMRPETIFGVTNLWINPNGKYVKAKINGGVWIISEQGAEKLGMQNRKVEILERFEGKKLVGKKAIAPLIDREVIILPGKFVDVMEASGVVYSVPAHSPWDYAGLLELKMDSDTLEKYGIRKEVIEIKPISVIKVKNYDVSTAELCEKYGVKNLEDREKIENLTEMVYREEFYNGILKESCGDYAGLNAKEAKEKVFLNLEKQGFGEKMYEVIAREKPVKCRCFGEVIVAILPDQWFIDYGNENWKKSAREALNSMFIKPEVYRKLFEDTIDWLHERPCARKRGIGTVLPWDKNYIIESLSDSTIYMALYTIIHHIKNCGIKAEKLEYSFWDYVFIGKGDVKEIAEKLRIEENALKKIRNEFLYWYPNDHRHTAIGHITNHLTFFIFNHVAIFPKKHWPKGITLNEYVIREGAKMSKSKGNVIPLSRIPEKYSADIYRLYIATKADLSSVVDWREEEINAVSGKIGRIFDLLGDIKKEALNFNELGYMDRWFVSNLNKIMKESKNLIENFEIQKYCQMVFFEVLNSVNYYLKRVEKVPKGMMYYLSNVWIRMLAPIIPHICEELWNRAGNKTLVSMESWPEPEEDKIDEEIIWLENLFAKTVEDIRHVLHLAGNKRVLYIYAVTEKELEYFLSAKKFLESEFGFRKVKVFLVGDKNKYDPQNKAKKAKVGKPGIYLE